MAAASNLVLAFSAPLTPIVAIMQIVEQRMRNLHVSEQGPRSGEVPKCNPVAAWETQAQAAAEATAGDSPTAEASAAQPEPDHMPGPAVEIRVRGNHAHDASASDASQVAASAVPTEAAAAAQQHVHAADMTQNHAVPSQSADTLPVQIEAGPSGPTPRRSHAESAVNAEVSQRGAHGCGVRRPQHGFASADNMQQALEAVSTAAGLPTAAQGSPGLEGFLASLGLDSCVFGSNLPAEGSGHSEVLPVADAASAAQPDPGMSTSQEPAYDIAALPDQQHQAPAGGAGAPGGASPSDSHEAEQHQSCLSGCDHSPAASQRPGLPVSESFAGADGVSCPGMHLGRDVARLQAAVAGGRPESDAWRCTARPSRDTAGTARDMAETPVCTASPVPPGSAEQPTAHDVPISNAEGRLDDAQSAAHQLSDAGAASPTRCSAHNRLLQSRSKPVRSQYTGRKQQDSSAADAACVAQRETFGSKCSSRAGYTAVQASFDICEALGDLASASQAMQQVDARPAGLDIDLELRMLNVQARSGLFDGARPVPF